MWKRDEVLRPSTSTVGSVKATDNVSSESRKRIGDIGEPLGRDVVNIGKSVIVKGELSGSENLTIEGQVAGKIELRQHVLTIGPHGKIKAQVFAKTVIVMGEVNGNITATERINIREQGSVDGDISSPRVGIAEGAHFRGSIDMQRAKAQTPTTVAQNTVKAVARATSQ